MIPQLLLVILIFSVNHLRLGLLPCAACFDVGIDCILQNRVVLQWLAGPCGLCNASEFLCLTVQSKLVA